MQIIQSDSGNRFLISSFDYTKANFYMSESASNFAVCYFYFLYTKTFHLCAFPIGRLSAGLNRLYKDKTLSSFNFTPLPDLFQNHLLMIGCIFVCLLVYLFGTIDVSVCVLSSSLSACTRVYVHWCFYVRG